MPLKPADFSYEGISQLFSLLFTEKDFAKIQDLISLGDVIIPDLELIINFGMENLSNLENDDEDYEPYTNAMTHALLMLGALKASSSFPIISKFAQMPQDDIGFILDDTNFVVLEYALAHCGYRNLEDLLSNFGNTERDQFERLPFSKAAMWVGKLYPENRERVVQYFREFLLADGYPTFEEEQKQFDDKTRGGFWFAEDDEDLPAMICLGLATMGYRELLPEIEQFYAEYKAYPGIASIEDIRKDLDDPSNISYVDSLAGQPLAKTYQWIDETFYQVRKYSHKYQPNNIPGGMVTQSSSSTTLVRKDPKIGRNDPCPVDGKKKFKKCCGGMGHLTCQKMS